MYVRDAAVLAEVLDGYFKPGAKSEAELKIRTFLQSATAGQDEEIKRMQELVWAAAKFGVCDIVLGDCETEWPDDLCERHADAYQALKVLCHKEATLPHYSPEEEK
jgi:hypothetical protein